MSEQPYCVTPLAPAEADTAVALWRECGLLRPWNDPHADIAAALGCPSATVLAAREPPERDGAAAPGEAGRIVATAMAGYDGHRGWLYYLAVASDRRGRGLGRAMVTAAEQWLHARGAPVVQLMVRDDNAAAHGFYQAIGYARSAVTVLRRPLG